MSNRKYTKRSIGIDLGTSKCCVGTWENNTVTIIPNDMGERITPSYIAFTESEILIGTAAKNQASRNSSNTIFGFMRLLGQKYDDPTVQSNIKFWPFKVVRESEDRLAIEVEYKSKTKKYFIVEIVAMMLAYMKQIAETYIGIEVCNAVISVPIHLTRVSQMETIKTAATIAGLNILRIHSSPTLASITYGLNLRESHNEEEKLIMLFDFGGGTLDCVLISLDDGVFEVKSVAYNQHLGGYNFDNILVDYFIKQFNKQHNIYCSESKRTLQRLYKQCEQIKRTLSVATKVNMEVDSLYNGIDFCLNITRSKFEDLCVTHELVYDLLDNVLKDALCSKSEINEIILFGGSSRIPRVEKMLKIYFDGKDPIKAINADEAATFGAAIYGGIVSGDSMGNADDFLLLDVTPLSLAVETTGGVMSKLIERNKTIPCKANETFKTCEENQSGVLIKIYSGERKLTRDNCFLGSIELHGLVTGLCDINASNDQCWDIYKKRLSKENPSNGAEIEVTFDLDANHRFYVTAKDKLNRENSVKMDISAVCVWNESKRSLLTFGYIRLTFKEANDDVIKVVLSFYDDMRPYYPFTNRFSSDELNKMMIEAKRNRIENEENRKIIKAKNELENKVYEIRDLLDDVKYENPETLMQYIYIEQARKTIKTILDWMDENSMAKRQEFEAKKQELEAIWELITGNNVK
eukprot:135072_1